jgi:type IV pilus assembly protein PilE
MRKNQPFVARTLLELRSAYYSIMESEAITNFQKITGAGLLGAETLESIPSHAHPKEMAMKATKGFTLIELMIVVVVISILMAVAIPSYTSYVTRGKIVEATSALSDGRVKMEQFYQDNRTYIGGPTPAATTNFSFSLTPAPTATTYTIVATGKGNISAYRYTINESNVKGSTTPWGNNTTCWVVKKGGQC